MNVDVDFALKMIGEQTLQIRMLNMVLEQSQKEIEELKKAVPEKKKNDKKNPKSAKGVQTPES